MAMTFPVQGSGLMPKNNTLEVAREQTRPDPGSENTGVESSLGSDVDQCVNTLLYR